MSTEEFVAESAFGELRLPVCAHRTALLYQVRLEANDHAGWMGASAFLPRCDWRAQACSAELTTLLTGLSARRVCIAPQNSHLTAIYLSIGGPCVVVSRGPFDSVAAFAVLLAGQKPAITP